MASHGRGLRRIARARFIPLIVAVWLSDPASTHAQTASPPSVQTAAETPAIALDSLRKLVDNQQALIDAQAARLDAQGRELADLRRRIDEVSTVALGASQVGRR